ncbi:hypothetical protein ACJA88_014150 [Fusarium oxysporum]
MSRPPSRQNGPRTSASNKGPGNQFLADGQGDQNVASSGGNLHNDHRQWNTFYIKRGMPSMWRTFANIDNHETDDNGVSAIIKWLTRQSHCRLADPRSRQGELLNQTTPNTGDWILETKEVQIWQKEEDENGYLSIQGHLGSGKSILLSGIIQSTERKVQESADMACVYFYFQEGDTDQIAVTSLWASLLQQLLQQSAPNVIAKELQEAFDISLQGTNSVHPFEYFNLFKAQASRFKVVYVIIDALDNCKDYDNGKVQQTLPQTLLQLPPSIRVLFSSRHDSLAQYLGFKRLLRISPCKTDIETFLLARLHLDKLGSNILLPDLRKDLEQLPVDLAHVFESSLRKIAKDCESPENGLAKHVLTCIIHGKEALAMDQVCEGFALTKDRGTAYQDWRPGGDRVLSVCAGLVVLDSDKMTLRLVHESARTSIFDHGIIPKRPGPEMAKICLICLLSCKDNSPLLSYAATQWTSHLHGIDLANDKELLDLIKTFLVSSTKLSRAFKKLSVAQDGVNGMTGLHAVAYLDLPIWVEPLVKYGIKVDAPCADGQTALHWAVTHGRRRVVRLLLRFRADPNVRDSSKDTPLHKFLSSPAFEGLDIAETLIKAGAKVCIANLKGVTPLSSAIRYGPTSAAKLFILSRKDINEEIEAGWTSLREVFDHGSGRIQQLGEFANNEGSLLSVKHAVKDHLHYLIDTHLEHNVILNRPTTSGWLALSHAAKNGSVTILKKLLEHKWDPADCNIKDPELGKSPLHWALEYGHNKAARLLVKGGAEINEKNVDGWNPLIEATKARLYDMAHFLITRGADVNATDNEGVSPLMHAVEMGDKDITWLLVVNGANVSLQAKDGTHAIDIAIARRDLSSAWLLCEHGANLKSISSKGETLLHQVAKGEHQETATFLLDRGLSISAKDHEDLTPLHHAVISGSDSMVSTIISRSKGSMDTPDGKGKSPLIYAVSNARLTIVQRLLTNGSSCDFRDADGTTALHYAAAEGFAAGLSSLVKHTYDIDMADDMGFTAVHHAVSNDKIDALLVLMTAKADLDILDRRGYTPLMLAVYLDRPEAARVLLDRGADIYKRNHQQMSAVDLEAKKKGGKTPSRTQPYIALALRNQRR